MEKISEDELFEIHKKQGNLGFLRKENSRYAVLYKIGRALNSFPNKHTPTIQPIEQMMKIAHALGSPFEDCFNLRKEELAELIFKLAVDKKIIAPQNKEIITNGYLRTSYLLSIANYLHDTKKA